ncbi:hypothetical protein [Paraburkholderia pallida]|uniref:Uncharacterized protein n=1 Tax=Paraburkholderia pallida TaxID=2547399 RepID=A0A4P7CYM4_9BURK|nr:hypothetical protein [Paraburkholderia pallida]QBR00598.1 hypothetical protein E1956_26580 [Paraburkholderia pallida]
MKPATPIVITAAALSSSLAFAQMPTPGIVVSTENQSGYVEMHELISMPKTAIDFIKNIKYAFDNNLLLDDHFFEKNNVCNAFSIDEKSCIPHEIHQPDGTHGISFYSGDFVGIFPREQNSIEPNSTQHHNPPPGSSISTAQISILKTANPLGIVNGEISLITRKDGPNFNETTNALDVNLHQVFEIPLHGVMPPPSIDAHGNETWKYETSNQNFRKNLVISFREDGTLMSIRAEIEKMGGHQ